MKKETNKGSKMIKKTIEKVVIDKETGEVLERQLEYSRIVNRSSETYVRIYMDNFKMLATLQPSCLLFLNTLLENMDYRDNSICISSKIRLDYANEHGKTLRMVEKYIQTLKEKGFIVPYVDKSTGRILRGMYYINPDFATRTCEKDSKRNKVATASAKKFIKQKEAVDETNRLMKDPIIVDDNDVEDEIYEPEE